MADSFTANLNLRKPEVGAAEDTWGGAAGLNADLDLIDAIFLGNGTGTSVGLHIGAGKHLITEGNISAEVGSLWRAFLGTVHAAASRFGLYNNAGVLSVTFDAESLTGLRTLTVPDESGTILTRIPGTILHGYWGNTPPAGFVFADGRTIGDASSGATNRANADTQALFLRLWGFNDNTRFPVLPSRGASAAADWAAHRQITLPDHSGRAAFGRDNLSGTARNRITTGVSGIAGTTLGAAGGDEHSQNHTHTITDPSHVHQMLTRVDLMAPAGGAAAYAAAANALGQTTQFAYTGITGTNGFGIGGSENMPPAIMCDVVIAL